MKKGVFFPILLILKLSYVHSAERVGVPVVHHNGDALYFAILAEDVSRVCIGINASCDVNATDEDGNSRLHDAAFGGSVAIGKVLIAAGADVNAADLHGWVDSVGYEQQPFIFSGSDTPLILEDVTIKAQESFNANYLFARCSGSWSLCLPTWR